VLYPFTFHPIFKERIWGGRNLERLYRKNLPPRALIGESWEISDRPGSVSVIANGPLAGKNLHWLMENHRVELLGGATPTNGNRFPLLCKILDAQEKLSLQVHPPAGKAAELGGEPKTEMWFITDAAPGAELFAGLKRDVTRAGFERKISDGSVAECFHRIPIVRPGDAIFLPSGCVHAIGAGVMVFEIQQNSDTTYRVFDWNRVGLDGKPRELHIAQSLASIDFSKYRFRPRIIRGKSKSRLLICSELFNIRHWIIKSDTRRFLKPGKLQIIAAIRGQIEIRGGSEAVNLSAGQFCLVPACLERTEFSAQSDAALLRVEVNES
jgi:mannose-6-phosphate isomerase